VAVFQPGLAQMLAPQSHKQLIDYDRPSELGWRDYSGVLPSALNVPAVSGAASTSDGFPVRMRVRRGISHGGCARDRSRIVCYVLAPGS